MNTGTTLILASVLAVGAGAATAAMVSGNDTRAAEEPRANAEQAVPDQRIADWDVQHAICAANLVTRCDVLAAIEQHNTDLFRIEIECHPQSLPRKSHQFLRLNARQPGHAGRAVSHKIHAAYLFRAQCQWGSIENALHNTVGRVENRE